MTTATLPTKPPTFTAAPKADPSPCPTDTCTLTAQGADDDGKFTFTWKCLFETRPVVFSANGSSAAKRTTVTFPAPGMYQFECQVRDTDGQTAVGRCSVVVQPYTIEIVEGISFGQPDTLVRCYDEAGSCFAMSGQPGNRPHLVRAVVNLWNDRKRLQEENAKLREAAVDLLASVAADAEKRASSVEECARLRKENESLRRPEPSGHEDSRQRKGK